MLAYFLYRLRTNIQQTLCQLLVLTWLASPCLVLPSPAIKVGARCVSHDHLTNCSNVCSIPPLRDAQLNIVLKSLLTELIKNYVDQNKPANGNVQNKEDIRKNLIFRFSTKHKKSSSYIMLPGSHIGLHIHWPSEQIGPYRLNYNCIFSLNHKFVSNVSTKK